MKQLKGFIAFEGIDGAGTTTQSEMLVERFKRSEREAILTFEPTDGPIGTFARQILKGDVQVDPRTIAHVFAADRNEHLFAKNGGIVNLTNQGKIVITDRYLFSSLAYQSLHCEYNLVKMLNSNFPMPELLFFVDIPIDVAMERIGSRETLDIYETEQSLKKVRDRYISIFEDYKESLSLVVIDGTFSMEEIHSIIWEKCKNVDI